MPKDRLLLMLCLAYTGGIFLGSFFPIVWWYVLLASASSCGFIVVFFPRYLLFFLLSMFVFWGGIFSVSLALNKGETMSIDMNQKVSGMARVVEEPETRSRYQQVIIRMYACDTHSCPDAKILWQAPLTKPFSFGSRIQFSCLLKTPKNFDTSFDYRMFLAKDDIYFICEQALTQVVLPNDMRASMAQWLMIPKHAFEKAIIKSVPQPEGGLALGLLLGGEHRLSEADQQIFRQAGLSHITAISGYNIALIGQLFLLCGLNIGLWRKQAIWLSALGIILFICLVGAPASAVRAGIMALTVFIGFLFGRLTFSINALIVAGVAMLVFQPLLLRYDIGFQLSFLATLAIILVLPFKEKWLTGDFFGKSIVEIFWLTLAVEILVTPIILYHFHTFAPFSLLANTLLLPLVPYAMASTFLTGATFLLLPGLHMMPAMIAYGFLRGIMFVAEQISLFDYATITLTLHPSVLFFWYGTIFFVIVMIKHWEK
ncbi:MAG: ComEC/Rec2 family competence protein [Minisyncoccota bacterium]